MKIVGNDRNSDCLSINILSLLQKVTTTKQISKRNKNENEKKKKRKTEGKKKGY